MTIALDGHNSGHASNGSSTSISLTTTSSNDIVLVAAYAEANSSSLQPAISSVSGTGTTGWASRSSIGLTGGTGYVLSLWWGTAAAALTAVSLTVGFSAHYDDVSLVAFGVSGAFTTTPWDGHVGLPNAANDTKNVAPAATISTTNAHDLLLAITGSTSATSAQVNAPPSGWSMIGFDTNGGGGLASQIGVAMNVVSAAQSGLTVTWGAAVGTVNANDKIPYIVDALTADAPGGALVIPYVRPRPLLRR